MNNYFKFSIFFLILFLSHAVPVKAANIFVDTSTDSVAADHLCSLREAISAVNGQVRPNGGVAGECEAGNGNNDIIYLPGETFLLLPQGCGQAVCGVLAIARPVKILGSWDVGHTVIDGNNATSLLDISPRIRVEIEGVSLVRGQVPADTFAGGAVSNLGELLLKNCSISGNLSDSGGGLYNHRGAIATLFNCTVNYNNSRRHGSGIYNEGRLDISNSTLFSNGSRSPATAGGALYTALGQVRITNSTIVGNTAQYGGGIYFLTRPGMNQAMEGSVHAKNSIFAENEDRDAAGGRRTECELGNADPNRSPFISDGYNYFSRVDALCLIQFNLSDTHKGEADSPFPPTFYVDGWQFGEYLHAMDILPSLVDKIPVNDCPFPFDQGYRTRPMDGDDFDQALCDIGAIEECNINEGCPAARNNTCGDHILDSGEECDDGNNVNSDGCTFCHLPRCGDGFTQLGVERCDDGNRTNNDACDNECHLIPGNIPGAPRAGVPIIQPFRVRIDPNAIIRDFNLAGNLQAFCGNGIRELLETCDDGGVVAGDGCDAQCQVEAGVQPVCGNGAIEAPETCDDGNVVAGDGCNAQCLLEPICGNGAVEAPETCDDGNQVAGDGCDAQCLLEAQGQQNAGGGGGGCSLQRSTAVHAEQYNHSLL